MSRSTLFVGSGLAAVIALGIDLFLRADLTFAIPMMLIVLLSSLRSIALMVAAVLLACAIADRWFAARLSDGEAGARGGPTLLLLGLGLIGVTLLAQLASLRGGVAGGQAWLSMLVSMVLYIAEITGAMVVVLGTIILVGARTRQQ